jgi:hypothetical protein
MMACYLAFYTHLQDEAVPVMVAPKTVTTEMWVQGYVSLEGTLTDHAAFTAGDELPLQTTRIWCARDKNMCAVAMADAFHNFLSLDLTVHELDSWTDRLITFSDDSSICVNATYAIDRVAQTFTMTVKKKDPIPDYALKSPLHPCDDVHDKTLTLDDGFPVYWHKRQLYEQSHGLYFHVLLVALNLGYGALVLWAWRRGKRRRAKREPETP